MITCIPLSINYSKLYLSAVQFLTNYVGWRRWQNSSMSMNQRKYFLILFFFQLCGQYFFCVKITSRIIIEKLRALTSDSWIFDMIISLLYIFMPYSNELFFVCDCALPPINVVMTKKIHYSINVIVLLLIFCLFDCTMYIPNGFRINKYWYKKE